MKQESNNQIQSESEILENHFQHFRPHIIGDTHVFESLNGKQELLYADWIASGRLYAPIEDIMCNKIGPMVANTHSFSSETGKASTYAYKHARSLIKKHVNANENDVLVTCGTGMTGVLARLQRIMGLRWPDVVRNKISLSEHERPVVFITHMEHHSNHVPWMETIADVVLLPSDENLLVDPKQLLLEIVKYKDRPLKIGSFTACSNVTGIITPFEELAKIMHRHGGFCFVDFAASAPYVKIDMHPADPEAQLDAIFFSPHKFLGGPGTCGVLVFNKTLYNTQVPDVPGGGNVKWTDPWGGFAYIEDIETKEDGGTPGFLQVMRTALCMELKEKMDVDKMGEREVQLLKICFDGLQDVPGLYILGCTDQKRIGCVSFGIQHIHYNLIVRLLNDRFGIQVRGGWSCASTYGHHLFGINKNASKTMTQGIYDQNLTEKPGWVRISLHPIMTGEEVKRICNAIKMVAENIEAWSKPYVYNSINNEYECKTGDSMIIEQVKDWFTL